MSITIVLPSVLSRHADGASHLQANGATVGEALDDLGRRYPHLGPQLYDPQGHTHSFVAFYLNDQDVRFNGGLRAPVHEGDVINVLTAIAGG